MTKGRGPNSRNRRRFVTPTPPNSSREHLPGGADPTNPPGTEAADPARANQLLRPPTRNPLQKSRSYSNDNSNSRFPKSRSLENADISPFNPKKHFPSPARSKEPSPVPENASQRSVSASGSRSPNKRSNPPRSRKYKHNSQAPPENTTSVAVGQTENPKQEPTKGNKAVSRGCVTIEPSTCRTQDCSILEAVTDNPGSAAINPNQAAGNWANEYSSLSFWDYFKAELGASEHDPEHEVKRERLTNFFKVPREFEKLMFFGFCVCLNSILYNFTILPTRILAAILALLFRPVSGKRLSPNQVCDLLRGSLICTSCYALSYLDLSKLYHAVRGQSVVKLYVIFNMLEIFDRLAASLGQDLLSSFFADITLEYAGRLRPVYHFIAASFYIPLHTAVLFYQMMALNVSVNSYNDALLSLLMSNQFVEIKGSVFKKFERETLFQLTCSDITERFQLTIFLAAITLRNISAIIGGVKSDGFARAVLPTSFRRLLPSSVATGMDLMLSPAVLVLVCEVLVDWVKHAFVTKFNHIRPSVYGRYLDLLCKDIVGIPGRTPHKTLADQSNVVARRLGLSVFPLTCLIIRVVLQLFDIRVTKLSAALHSWSLDLTRLGGSFLDTWSLAGDWPNYSLLDTNTLLWILAALLVFISLTIVKLLLGLHLLRLAASRYTGLADREAADVIAAQEDLKQNYKELNLIKQQLACSEAEDLYRPKNLNLDTIDRFSLFKSRVP